MSSKKILLISPGPLFPTIMANQVRIKLLTQELSKKHSVDLITLEDVDVRDDRVYNGLCRSHYPILIPNHKNSFVNRGIYALGRILICGCLGLPPYLYYSSLRQITKKINDVISENEYDIIQVEYWYMAKCVMELKPRPFLAIDTHYVSHKTTEMKYTSKKNGMFRMKGHAERVVEKERRLETRYISLFDLVISISRPDECFFKEAFPGKKIVYVPTGIEMEDFLNSRAAMPRRPTILFYGSLGSFQNTSAFFELWSKIFPIIKKEVPDVRLKVVGANPSEGIKQLGKLDYVEVTGFVNNLTEVLSSCHLKILPMKVGDGFRTRLVEVMACGVPVVGTHLGVDSLEIEEGVHGYISDDYEVLAERAVELLKDDKKRRQMSLECKKYVADNFSLQNTYGKLCDYYFDLAT